MYNVFFAEIIRPENFYALTPLAQSLVENMNEPVTTEKVIITVITVVVIVMGFCIVSFILLLRIREKGGRSYEHRLSAAEMSKLFD